METPMKLTCSQSGVGRGVVVLLVAAVTACSGRQEAPPPAAAATSSATAAATQPAADAPIPDNGLAVRRPPGSACGS